MSATRFVDTNLLVYARDAGETDKQTLAESCWVDRAQPAHQFAWVNASAKARSPIASIPSPLG